MRSKININQIAYLSGYSKSTVSKALNDSEEISEKAKLRIRKIADSYNYKPNFSAKALKSKRTNTIGLIVPEFSKIHYASIMEGIEEEATRRGYNLVVRQSKNNLSRKKRIMYMLFDGSIDGLIMITDERFAPKCEIDYINKVLDNPLPSIKIDFSNCLGRNGARTQTKAMGKEMFADLTKIM